MRSTNFSPFVLNNRYLFRKENAMKKVRYITDAAMVTAIMGVLLLISNLTGGTIVSGLTFFYQCQLLFMDLNTIGKRQ